MAEDDDDPLANGIIAPNDFAVVYRTDIDDIHILIPSEEDAPEGYEVPDGAMILIGIAMRMRGDQKFIDEMRQWLKDHGFTEADEDDVTPTIH